METVQDVYILHRFFPCQTKTDSRNVLYLTYLRDKLLNITLLLTYIR